MSRIYNCLVTALMVVGLLAGVTILCSSQAYASPCAEDFAKFCKDWPEGKSGMACLKQHEKDLSPQCRETIQSASTTLKPQTFQNPCKGDIAKYCAEATKSRGGTAQCLKDNQAKLTPECRDHLAKTTTKDTAIQGICQREIEQFCKDVSEKGGDTLACLRTNASQLSPACKAKVEQTGSRAKTSTKKQ